MPGLPRFREVFRGCQECYCSTLSGTAGRNAGRGVAKWSGTDRPHGVRLRRRGRKPRAVPFDAFARALFPSAGDDARAAARGLLFARGLAEEDGGLPSFRLHWFFRNVEGLWACTESQCCPSAKTEHDGRTAGRLYGDTRLLCDGPIGHRVLELLYCEQCGTTMFGGARQTLADGSGWELLATDPDLEGLPDRQAARFLDQRAYDDYGIFWPRGLAQLHPDASQFAQPLVGQNGSVPGRWIPPGLDPRSGRVELSDGAPIRAQIVPGFIFIAPQGPPVGEQVSALPGTCPRCADYRTAFRRSPVEDSGPARKTQSAPEQGADVSATRHGRCAKTGGLQ